MLIEIKALSKSYTDGTKALKQINLDIEQGQFIAIIGPSGAGKSTLLRCLNQLVLFDEGDVSFEGQSLKNISKKELRRLRTQMGMIFQHYNLVPQLGVIENVLHGRLGYKSTIDGMLSRYTEQEKQDALTLLEELGLSAQTFKRASELSGGQMQRVGIARALIQQPKLILCDEPIASLDPSSAMTILKALKKITVEKGITCLVNLHQIEEAKTYADRIIGLSNGAVVFDGPPSSLDENAIKMIYGVENASL